MILVIMAAGMGSRFGGLKQIEAIDKEGNFIIDYSIYDAIRFGFKKVIFIIKEENYEIFRNTIGSRIENVIDVEYVFQDINNIPKGYSVPKDRVKPWGTAHAILSCKGKINDDFAIINADDFYGADAYSKLSTFMKENKKDNQYAVIGYKIKNTITDNGSVKRGICETSGKYLVKLIESKVQKIDDKYIANSLACEEEKYEIDKDTVVSMNMFAFKKEIIDYIDKKFVEFFEINKDKLDTCEFFLPDIVFDQVKNNLVKVQVVDTTSVWHGITYKEDKENVVLEIQKLKDKRIYPQNLWKKRNV